MRFTYTWLKNYVDFAWSPQELADRLTFAGVEVEAVISVGGGLLNQVVVVQILSSEKHPNADRLSVCQVTDGTAARQIVCGAKNYQVGDKVPLARPGVSLPNGLTIKPTKLRGVESQGMLCSAQELGLTPETDGLLILPSDTVVGRTLSDALGGADTVYEIKVTPNRPDWLSVIGIAREVAALGGSLVRLPDVSFPESAATTDSAVTVTLAAPDLCPRYTARVIRGVKIGPSPAWLRQILERVGLRSINNVVDVTNYVLLEAGHPLHAFDYHLLQADGSAGAHSTGSGPAASPSRRPIIVRRAQPGEVFEALDDSRHELTTEMLVIADGVGAVALAGIMGGKNSEIKDTTVDVLLESAWFLPPNIRRTSKRLGLASESSYRFERGTDIEGLVWASQRATALIQQLAGGQVSRGLVDALARPITRRRVTCRFAQVNRLLGIDVPPETVRKIFTGLGLTICGVPGGSPGGAADACPELVERVPIGRASGEHLGAWGQAPLQNNSGRSPSIAGDAVEVEVPSYRVDLEREVDLIEEVCRVHGVEKIPSRMQARGGSAVSAFDAAWDAQARVRRALTALGYHEARNQTLGLSGVLKLQNPLSVEQAVLRAALVPGLLGNLRTNASRHQNDVQLFEIGHVFAADGRSALHLGLAATGRRFPQAWEAEARAARVDFFDVKGALEELADQLGLAGLTIGPIEPGVAPVAPAAAAQQVGIGLAGRAIGALWQVPAAEARALDLRAPVIVAELVLDAWLTAGRADKQYRELPKFPAVVRDMALVVDESVSHGDILAAIAHQQLTNLERVELFDIFRGGSIAPGRKSLAYSLTFRAAERTLTDAEVNAAHQELKRRVQQAVPCEIRES